MHRAPHLRLATIGAVALTGLIGVPAAGSGTPSAVVANVTCHGERATIIGTPGKDDLRGTHGPDVIAGLGGADVIHGNAGDDTICGGGGPDQLYGDRGFDLQVGGRGPDHIFGRQAPPLVEPPPYPEIETVLGGAGDDVIVAAEATFRGGGGNDLMRSSKGAPSCLVALATTRW